MIIEIPGRDDLRISGEGNDWSVQSVIKEGKSAGGWRPSNYFAGLEHAIAFVYEKVLRDMELETDIEGAVKECAKVKKSLLNAVKKAIADA